MSLPAGSVTMNEDAKGASGETMARPLRTREGVFLLAGLLAGVGLVLAISGSPFAATVALLVASAAVLTAGVVREVLAFLHPGTDGSRRQTPTGPGTDCNSDARPNGENVHRTQ